MRIASRIVGILLAIAGLGFIVVGTFASLSNFQHYSVLVESNSGKAWIAGLTLAVFGVGFILASRYFFRLDVHAIDERPERPASKFAPYFIAHRRELKIIAQLGLVVSLILLGAACFGTDWPGRWVKWALFPIGMGLLVVEAQIVKTRAGDHLDWDTVPDRMRPGLNAILKVGKTAFLILALLWVRNVWSAHKRLSPALILAFAALLFAWEAVFFAYGEVRTDDGQATALKM